MPHKFSGRFGRNARYPPLDFKERSTQAVAFPWEATKPVVKDGNTTDKKSETEL